jgi:hypothetical protein
MAFSNIDKPNSYFNTVLFTGNSTARSITGVNFSPDLVWIKARNTTSNHFLMDSVRGGTKTLLSDVTDSEYTGTYVTSFDSDGFSIGSTSINVSPYTYVSWSWRGSDSSAVSNTAGTITSTVSANTTSGFSIVSYTGTGANATVGHGLGVAPSMLIVKSRNTTSTYWCIYQKSMWEKSGADYTLLLPLTNASASRPTLFNSTQPTSSVFSIGDNGGVNGNTQTYIAYCFAEVKGYSKFGSYTGNGSTDGTFIYTGFSPAFVMFKRTDSTSGWGMFDNKREPFNLNDTRLLANTSGADDTSTDNGIDFLSNGFKWRTASGWNASAGTYIYMAFSENPFVSSKGIPTTAR